MRSIRFLPFDQLHRNFGVLKEADKKEDLIVLIESQAMVTGADWHPERLFFLISAARHFASELESDGYQVKYLKAKNTVAGLKEIQKSHPNIPLICAEQSSFRLSKNLNELAATYLPNDFFLTSRSDFKLWAGSQKTFLMENFYRKQRVRLNILMVGKNPVGGAWNFDKENRLPPPKNYTWPAYLEHDRDEIDTQVANELGIEMKPTWATTRKGALKQLNYFIKNHFANFGPYEDAMALDSWTLHHSLLSPYLNNGLLHPGEVVDAALIAFEKGKVQIESAEAFIRQIIGWREYVNGMYWFLGPEFKDNNQLGANRKLLPLFTDPSKTKMNCIKSTVQDIEERAWVHHIPRLMLLSNLALITGTNPQEFLEWMRRVFIDATDWVMVPNVIGMGLHADGGLMMTKPYAAGGAYISRMSNYCKGCSYNPKLRIGDDACPFTTLYWDFLERHKESFAKNHRMSQQIFGLKRLNDLPELKERAKEVLEGLEKGKI
jgi:deoxyribodipyrimidine photolyase-related protein